MFACLTIIRVGPDEIESVIIEPVDRIYREYSSMIGEMELDSASRLIESGSFYLSFLFG